VCLRRPCVRFAICMTVHRSKCHLETVRLFQYKIWWTDGSDYCLMPVFLHTFQRENTYAKLHENAPFEMKNYKNFPPQTSPHRGGGYPLPRPHLLGASTLVPSIGIRQLPRMSSDPRNAPAPRYLTELAVRVASTARRRLRSVSSADLVVPSTRRSTVGDRAFAVAGPRAAYHLIFEHLHHLSTRLRNI